jgi:hypothetical protein
MGPAVRGPACRGPSGGELRSAVEGIDGPPARLHGVCAHRAYIARMIAHPHHETVVDRAAPGREIRRASMRGVLGLIILIILGSVHDIGQVFVGGASVSAANRLDPKSEARAEVVPERPTTPERPSTPERPGTPERPAPEQVLDHPNATKSP